MWLLTRNNSCSATFHFGSSSLQNFINDLFLLPKSCNIANYADDNTLYATGDCFEVIIKKLYADLTSF